MLASLRELMDLNVKHISLVIDTPDGECTLDGPVQGTLTLTLPSNGGGNGGDFIRISPGESIQDAVNANPENTKFKLLAGVHKRQQVIPKTGNVFEGESGTVLDGESAAEHAFRTGNPPFPSNVQIRGLEIRYYASPAQRAAVEAGVYSTQDASEGWIIENNEVHHNGCIGIKVGNRAQVRNNNVHHNHCLNIGGSGDGAVVEGNKIDFGNFEYRYVPGFEAGGTKFTLGDGMVIRNNTFYKNSGPSLWFDENAINILIEGNTIDDGDQEGIVIEICYAATIRNNVVTNCGWRDSAGRYTWLWNTGIGVHSSPDCEVSGNQVSGCWSAIGGIQQDRDHEPNPPLHGPHIVSNLWVHDNQVSQSAEPSGDEIAVAAGLADDTGGTAAFDSRNNRFTGNVYTLSGSNRHPFAWMNGPRTEDEWHNYGQQ